MLMVWIKTAGILLTAAGAAGTGISMGLRYRDHLRLLEDLRKMITLLKGEILYDNAPLEEAFAHAGERSSCVLSGMFTDMSKRIAERNGESFYEMWQEEVDRLDKEVPLSNEDRRQLKGLGQNLGYLDHAMQERTILLYLEQLDGEITYLREHLQEKNRLYTSLGIAAGLFLIIVMC